MSFTEQFVINMNQVVAYEACMLLLIVGDDYFSYAVLDEDQNICELKRIYFGNTTVQQMDAVVNAHSIFNNSFAEIITAFDFNVNTLLPAHLNTGDNTALMYLNNAGPKDHIINEIVAEWELSNIYAVPYQLLNWVVHHFPSSKFWHVQSIYLKAINTKSSEDLIYLDVKDKKFNLTVVKGGKLQLAQSYKYTSPEDVLFYLLKVCESFDLQQEKVQLYICGLIDEGSALFKLLYDYFLNIFIKNATWKQGKEYPAHYFTLLNQLASCAS
ncbi:MAG: DUF3822 family protein [Niabella sp.]